MSIAMSREAKDFINDWIMENVNPEAYDEEDRRAAELAEQCRADAREAGLSDSDLDDAVEDMVGGGSGLVRFIGDALERATHDEVRRLADKAG